MWALFRSLGLLPASPPCSYYLWHGAHFTNVEWFGRRLNLYPSTRDWTQAPALLDTYTRWLSVGLRLPSNGSYSTVRSSGSFAKIFPQRVRKKSFPFIQPWCQTLLRTTLKVPLLGLSAEKRDDPPFPLFSATEILTTKPVVPCMCLPIHITSFQKFPPERATVLCSLTRTICSRSLAYTVSSVFTILFKITFTSSFYGPKASLPSQHKGSLGKSSVSVN